MQRLLRAAQYPRNSARPGVVLLLLGLYLLCAALSTSAAGGSGQIDSATALEQIAKIETPADFEKLCLDASANFKRFAACREKLPVFQGSFLWISTDFLLQPGESLTPDRLGTFYGLNEPKWQPARVAIGAILIAKCQQGQVLPEEVRFGSSLTPACRKSLPTLTELGLMVDPAWAGVEMKGDIHVVPAQEQ